eukprot:6191266-Pleurochrysis_carterae.AAC.3
MQLVLVSTIAAISNMHSYCSSYVLTSIWDTVPCIVPSNTVQLCSEGVARARAKSAPPDEANRTCTVLCVERRWRWRAVAVVVAAAAVAVAVKLAVAVASAACQRRLRPARRGGNCLRRRT